MSAGKVVAITGGARGIGLATAKAFRAAGARVAIGDLDQETATKAAAGLGDDVLAAGLDVRDAAGFSRFVQLVERELGPVDVLVNNAGIMSIGPFADEDPSAAQRMLDVNVAGVLNGMRCVLPGMVARRRGHVVNVASVAGRAPVPGGLTYAATKAAIVSATETARVEFAGSGVAFTCVMPSFTSTELIAGTKGTKGIGTVTPETVAQAIVEAVQSGRKDVFVPKSLAPIIKVTPALGRRLRDALNRRLGAYDAFLDVDARARAAYEARIAEAERAVRPPSTAPR